MRIEVTESDIAAGLPGECGRCPVALALARALGVEVWVDPVFVWRPVRPVSGFWDAGRAAGVKVRTPEPASEFIEQFDQGRRPGPFGFDLPEKDARTLKG